MKEQTSSELLLSLNFCVIDLETTGGNHLNDQIIEVGMVRVRNLKIVETKNFLVNPEKKIPEFIQKLTSIKQEDVAASPTIIDLIDEIIEFIGDDIIVAHNTSFDVPFLNSVMKRLERPELENKVICTNVMTKHMIPEIMTSNLNYMSQLFEIDHDNAHRAKDDAMATAKLLLKFLKIFEAKGIKKINQLYYPRNKFELDRVNFESDTPISEILTLIKKQQENPLSISFKAERGLILAVLPIESPLDEIEFIEKMLEDLDWKLLTIKLNSGLIEGLFQFNNHFQKYNEKNRAMLLDYLNDKHLDTNNTKGSVSDYELLIGHHIVRNQVCIYNFLNLNTNTKNLFKIPAQKKKMYNFVASQINKFVNNQKRIKRTILHKEVADLVSSHIEKNIKSNQILSISIKEFGDQKDATLKKIESFTFSKPRGLHFPQNHL